MKIWLFAVATTWLVPGEIAGAADAMGNVLRILPLGSQLSRLRRSVTDFVLDPACNDHDSSIAQLQNASARDWFVPSLTLPVMIVLQIDQPTSR